MEECLYYSDGKCTANEFRECTIELQMGDECYYADATETDFY